MLPLSRRVVIMLAVGWLLRASATAALDWPMYGRDLKHSFTNADSLINAGSVALLLPAWDFATTDAVSASPTVVDGRVYVGAWDGVFYALDSASGRSEEHTSELQSRGHHPLPTRRSSDLLDWPMYGRDLKHSFTNADSLINAGSVALLLPAWDFATTDAVSASPTVVDGRVYVGAWDGVFYALDSASG